MKRSKAISFAIIAFIFFSSVDGIAYAIYSIERGFYFFAPLDHIVEFHGSGLGLATLLGMLLSALTVIVLLFFPLQR